MIGIACGERTTPLSTVEEPVSEPPVVNSDEDLFLAAKRDGGIVCSGTGRSDRRRQ